MNGRQARAQRHAMRVSDSDPFMAQIEAASLRDKAWFAAHPGRDRYVRRRMYREFGMQENSPGFCKDARYVEVTQIVPGIRNRQPIVVMRHSDYPSGHMPLEHVEAFIEQVAARGGQWRVIEDDEIDEATA